MSALMQTILALSPAEKLKLAEELWDDLAANPEAVPVHDWQKEELDRRDAELEANPDSFVTWEQVLEYVRVNRGS